MMRKPLLRGYLIAMIAAALGPMADISRAVLYVYEPFNYDAGENLGGVDNDPDPMGPAGTPVGQSGTYAGGGAYTWYARGTTSNYQSHRDAVVSSGNLSYPGLASSVGNSVSYGSGLPNPANDAFHKSLYADAFALPNPVTSGSLYASFIMRIKSDVENGLSTADRHSPVALIPDLTNAGNAGAALAGQSGTGVAEYGASFWMRRDPDDATLTTSNFSPGKSSSDGIGPGATGNTAGWQRSVSGGGNTEANQFGDINGQPEAVFADSGTWQKYFIVLKYEFDAQDPGATGQADTVSLWMNPGSGTLGTATGEADASQAPTGNLGSYYGALDAVGTATGDTAAINSFALIAHRQNTNETIAVDFDELRIGTTWADVTPTAVPGFPGDFNEDGKVDAADYVSWRSNETANDPLPNDNGLATQAARFDLWRANFGNMQMPGGGSGAGGSPTGVPEPASLAILLTGMFVILCCGRARALRTITL